MNGGKTGMKILTLMGSPHTNGSAERLLQSLMKGLDCDSSGINSVKIAEKRIAPCKACDCCKKEIPTFCVLKDDMQAIYPLFIDADTVVVATPIHWWGTSSHVKLLWDRLYALNFEKYPERFQGKRIILLLAYAGEEPNSGVDCIERTFREICDYTGMHLSAVLGMRSTEVTNDYTTAKLEEAFNIGRGLSAR